jgi:Family of unknown function (DUF6159)
MDNPAEREATHGASHSLIHYVGLHIAVTALGFAAMGTFGRANVSIKGLMIWDLARSKAGDIYVTDILLALVSYLALVFTVMFFNSVLISAAYGRIQGGSAALRPAFIRVLKRLPDLLAWGCFAATFGVLLNYVQSSNNLMVKVVGWILGIAWAFTTFFVLPILIVEGIGPREALRRSAGLFTKTWGKQVRARVGFSLAWLVVMLPLIVPCINASSGEPLPVVITSLVLVSPIVIAGIVVVSAMETVFYTALYHYVATSEISKDFPTHFISGAFGSKEKQEEIPPLYRGPSLHSSRGAESGPNIDLYPR